MQPIIPLVHISLMYPTSDCLYPVALYKECPVPITVLNKSGNSQLLMVYRLNTFLSLVFMNSKTLLIPEFTQLYVAEFDDRTVITILTKAATIIKAANEAVTVLISLLFRKNIVLPIIVKAYNTIPVLELRTVAKAIIME